MIVAEVACQGTDQQVVCTPPGATGAKVSDVADHGESAASARQGATAVEAGLPASEWQRQCDGSCGQRDCAVHATHKLVHFFRRQLPPTISLNIDRHSSHLAEIQALYELTCESGSSADLFGIRHGMCVCARGPRGLT